MSASLPTYERPVRLTPQLPLDVELKALDRAEIAKPLANVRCSRRAPSGLPYERHASGIAKAECSSVDGDALAAELGR